MLFLKHVYSMPYTAFKRKVNRSTELLFIVLCPPIRLLVCVSMLFHLLVAPCFCLPHVRADYDQGYRQCEDQGDCDY